MRLVSKEYLDAIPARLERMALGPEQSQRRRVLLRVRGRLHAIAQKRGVARLLLWGGFVGPDRDNWLRHDEYNRQRARRFYVIAVMIHVLVVLPSVISIQGCRHKVPAGVPMGKGNTLTKGDIIQVQLPKKIKRRQRVRKSPVSVYEMLKDEDLASATDTNKKFADNVGVPGGVGEGACAAGSPRGTVLGAALYFYRIKFDGPDWDANTDGVRPLLREVVEAGVVKKVGSNNVVSLKDLPRHSGEYFPALLYITGTGPINATDEEVRNLRDYLMGGGMLFADVSGGTFHEHFVNFMRRVLPQQQLTVVEFDHEIYRGSYVPFSMQRGCPIYRKHTGSGPALGIWLGPRLSVFYSRGDLGSGWAAAGIYRSRRRDVEQAYRMGVNIISYSLLYYKVTSS